MTEALFNRLSLVIDAYAVDHPELTTGEVMYACINLLSRAIIHSENEVYPREEIIATVKKVLNDTMAKQPQPGV